MPDAPSRNDHLTIACPIYGFRPSDDASARMPAVRRPGAPAAGPAGRSDPTTLATPGHRLRMPLVRGPLPRRPALPDCHRSADASARRSLPSLR